MSWWWTQAPGVKWRRCELIPPLHPPHEASRKQPCGERLTLRMALWLGSTRMTSKYL
jgi:hypothetical protein